MRPFSLNTDKDGYQEVSMLGLRVFLARVTLLGKGLRDLGGTN